MERPHRLGFSGARREGHQLVEAAIAGVHRVGTVGSRTAQREPPEAELTVAQVQPPALELAQCKDPEEVTGSA